MLNIKMLDRQEGNRDSPTLYIFKNPGIATMHESLVDLGIS